MRKFLYITVFFSGMTSLAIEMAASRLLGNIFGTSNIVWASIIGLILLYLAGGYFLGGLWADRSPTYKTFFSILILAALFTAVVPLISQPVLKLAANAFDQLELGLLFGSFTAVIILLSIPMTLLGTASPFAIRLALEDGKTAGKISGRIYAISTLGSFLGTFLPVLVFIPLIGTYRTFLVFSAILMIVGFTGLWMARGRLSIISTLLSLILFFTIALFGVTGHVKATSDQVYETESAYNYIQVLRQGDYFLLRLNEGQGIHSVYNPNQLNYYGSWEQVLVAPFFNDAPYELENVKEMAIVGLAAGTTARQATLVFENIHIDGYEIDPKIVEVGRTYFDMNQENLDVFVQDGRWGMTQNDSLYQVISIDAYRPPYIPAHLTTIEFFEIVKKHMTEDGVLAINVGRSPDDRSLINALATTIRAVFPSIYVVDIPNTFNSMIFATVQETQIQNLEENLEYLQAKSDVHPLLIDSMRIAANNLQPDPERTIVFTDDKSPVEWITNRMILDFLVSGDVEQFQ